MKPAYALIVFAVVAALQIAVPVKMIRDYEAVLKHGTAYTFRVEPIDPYDPFRGRYVRLGFPRVVLPWPEGLEHGYMVEHWITLSIDDDGYAIPAAIHAERPDDPTAIKVRIYAQPRAIDDVVDYENLQYDAQIYYPFDRFYMEEFLAPEAEQLLRNRTDRPETAVVVRILDGSWAIADLVVEGVPIADYLRQRAAQGIAQ